MTPIAVARKRLIGWIVAGVLVASSAIGAFAYRRAHRAPEVQIHSARVDRGRIVAKVTATGTLSALVTVQVGSQVSGRIASIEVDFNSPVHKGEVLAKIDPRTFEAAREQAEAALLAARGDLASAKARARDAERQYLRSRMLASEELIAPADFDTARANSDAANAAVEAAKGRVAQASASERQARVNLGYTIITSPIDGIVVSRNVDVGQTVAASFQAPVLFVLAEDLHEMQVDASVAEADVGKLTAAMNAQFRVDAYPGEVFGGTVRQVRNAPQTIQNVVTYDAVVDVANPDLKLKPGMTANVTFVWAARDAALRVPNAALRFHPSPDLVAKMSHGLQAAPANEPESKWRAVWLLVDGHATSVPILPGVTDGSYTEVVEGALHEGDTVITEAVAAAGQAAPPGANPMRRMF